MTKTQPFSIRLSRDASLLVEDEMRRSGRSKSAVVQEFAEEAAKMRLFPGIAFRDRPRRPWIPAAGMDVWEIVLLHQDQQGDLPRLLRAHRSLTELSVRLALAYADRFPEDVEPWLIESRRPLEELRALHPFVGTSLAEKE